MQHNSQVRAMTWHTASGSLSTSVQNSRGLGLGFGSLTSYNNWTYRAKGVPTSRKMSTSPVKAAPDHAVLLESLEKAADEYPKPEGVTFTYGTAGFRTL